MGYKKLRSIFLVFDHDIEVRDKFLILGDLEEINGYKLLKKGSFDVYVKSESSLGIVEIDIVRFFLIEGERTKFEFSVTFDCFESFLQDPDIMTTYGEYIDRYEKFFPYYMSVYEEKHHVVIENSAYIDFEEVKNKVPKKLRPWAEFIETFTKNNPYYQATAWLVEYYKIYFKLRFGL